MFLCYILRLITDDDLWEKKRETIKNEQKSTFESQSGEIIFSAQKAPHKNSKNVIDGGRREKNERFSSSSSLLSSSLFLLFDACTTLLLLLSFVVCRLPSRRAVLLYAYTLSSSQSSSSSRCTRYTQFKLVIFNLQLVQTLAFLRGSGSFRTEFIHDRVREGGAKMDAPGEERDEFRREMHGVRTESG